MHRAPQELRTYFVTTATANRRRLFQIEANAQLLVAVMQEQRIKNRFRLHTFVVMPDHLHAVITPAPDVSVEKAVQFIKGNFSHRLKSKLAVWAPSFNETCVRDYKAFESFCYYIHQNPVRALLVSSADAFPHSSAGRQHLVDPVPAHLKAARARG